MKKSIFILTLLLITGSFIFYPTQAEAGDKSEDEQIKDTSSSVQAIDTAVIFKEIRKLKDKLGESDNLKKRIKELEKKVLSQKKVIDQIVEALLIKEKTLAPPQPKVLVKKFIIHGVQLFNAEDLDPILSKYRNKELSMSDLEKIADKLTKFYRSKRYISSVAYVPVQEIENNTAQINVIEGRVGDIKIEGGKYYKPENVERKCFIEKGQVLNYAELDKNLRRINKQPDRTVEAVIEPGKEKGTSDITLKTEDQRPWHITGDYTNQGTVYTTKNRYGIGLTNNNLLGFDDIFSAKFKRGDRSDIYSVSCDYNFPITGYDTRIGVYGAYSNAEIGGLFEVLTPEGKAIAYGIYVSHPLFDEDFQEPISFTLGMNLIAGIDSISVWNKMLGQETSHDELRVLKAGFSMDEKDSAGRTFITQNLRVGLDDVLGSMDRYDIDSSRLDASSGFVKNTGSFTRITRLPASSYLIGTIRYQLTSEPLVSSEQLSIGGADSVRGYPENEYFADYGTLASAELRIPVFIFPRGLKVPYDKKHTAISDAVQFVCFADMGKGKLKKARVGEQADIFLAGLGVGLRIDLYDSFNGKIDWGFPIKEEPSDGSSSTVHIGIGYKW